VKCVGVVWCGLIAVDELKDAMQGMFASRRGQSHFLLFLSLFIYLFMRGMFASRRGSISACVINHGTFVLSFYSILINVCM
jgi:hypothetical protein